MEGKFQKVVYSAKEGQRQYKILKRSKNEQIQGKYQDNKKEIFFYKVTGNSFIIYKLEYYSLSSSV